MQLNQLKFLVAVDQYGSISKAAQELYISQSTVSLALINLEEELELTILNRGKRGVSFTPEGKIVLEKAKRIMEEVKGIQSIHLAENDITGEVSIGSSSHFGMSIITDMTIQASRQYAGLNILAQRESMKDIVKKVAQKELDLGFINYNSLNITDVQNDMRRYALSFHQIFRDKLCICVGAEHPLMQKETVFFDELLDYDLMSLAFKVDAFLYQYFQAKGYKRLPVPITDTANLRKYAIHTNALVIIPQKEISYSNKTYTTQLYALTVAGFDVDVIVGWLHHGDHEMTLAEKKVIELLERQCQRYQDMNN